jgi:hypothetical protein
MPPCIRISSPVPPTRRGFYFEALKPLPLTRLRASMSPKRTGPKSRRINAWRNTDALGAELHLREQQRASAVDPLDRPPLFTTEQLAIMNLRPDARHLGRPLAPMGHDNDDFDSPPQLPSRTLREIQADIESRPHVEQSSRPTLSAVVLERDHRDNSAASCVRGEIDSCRHQAPMLTITNDARIQSESQYSIMASDLAAGCLTTEDSTKLTNLRNARDLAAATQSAEQLIRANRAASTRKSYDQKIERWKQWCMERHFEDHDTVTENKLFLYLHSEIIPNGVQTHGKRKGAALSEEGLDGYIKPVVALYKVPPPLMEIILNCKGASS